jgi:tetratricopeptide (TPR) repeat protein
MNESISASICAYYKAAEEDDKVSASRVLEELEALNLDEPAWEIVRAFYERQSFLGRLEVITRRLIRSQPRISIRPYITLVTLLVRSNQLEEAKRTIASGRATLGNVAEFQWDILNALFLVEDFEESLQMVQKMLAEGPDQFSVRAMECKVLWKLGRHRDARSRLQKMRLLLGDNVDDWTWFGAIAAEFNETRIARENALSLVKLMEDKGTQISPAVVFYLINTGCEPECKRLIENADPERLRDQSELDYFFEKAWDFGSYKAVRRFGEAILRIRPDLIVQERLKGLALLQRLEGP